MLHVVWVEAISASNQNVPSVLSLKNSLDAPLAELSLSFENEPLRSLPENLRGKCSAPLRDLAEPQLAELLQAAATVRFENKAGVMLARAKDSGWEQVLWENLFRALGYKHNVWPIQNLAETKPRWSGGAKTAFEIQARLLGVSGLLPDELTRSQKFSDTFLRHAWDFWWRERDEFGDCVLRRAAWEFHGLRPANHPQRRLALARTGWPTRNLFPKLKTGVRRKFPAKNPRVHCTKFSNSSVMNSGRGTGLSNPRGSRNPSHCSARRASRIWP
jgi:hypothetical protein